MIVASPPHLTAGSQLQLTLGTFKVRLKLEVQ